MFCPGKQVLTKKANRLPNEVYITDKMQNHSHLNLPNYELKIDTPYIPTNW